MLVFVFATLKAAGIQREAMGHTAQGEAAYLFGWRETTVEWGGTKWPTIVPASSRDDVVPGEVFDVSQSDLAKLDGWEDAYRRIKVETRPTGAIAWAYAVDPLKLRRNE